MSDINARTSIPDPWGEKANCPFCAAPKLVVYRLPDQPDQLHCTKCNLAFELESNGARLHVIRWPAILELLDRVTEDWLTGKELQGLTQKDTPPPVPPRPVDNVASGKPLVSTPASQPTAEPIPVQDNKTTSGVSEEIVLRIKKLRDLGNSPWQVRNILEQAGVRPEKIQVALEAAGKIEQREQAFQQKKMWRSLGILGLVLIPLITAGILLLRANAPQPGQEVSPLQATLMPGLAEALNLNTPVVQYSAPSGGSSPSSCPRTSEQAATLFGGQSGAWTSPPNSNGWVMIDTGQANTIFVPKSMKAAYLELGTTMTLVEVPGPATLGNLHYVAISCP